MDEIEKLRVRVEKDPSSRLFLPLAEEYRKSRMLDEAISVLLKGLERQPGYTSARAALGKIYLEKNMTEEAKNEFENVVSIIPDNLFAHKKLADIYRERGETEKAIAEYKRVIQLNPLDEDARASLTEIEEMSLEEMISFPFPEVEAEEFPAPPEVPPPIAVEEPIEEPLESLEENFQEFKAVFPETGGEDLQEDEDFLEISEDQAFDLSGESTVEELFSESPETSREAFVPPPAPLSPKGEDLGAELDLSTADALIAKGNYYRALEKYKEGLTANPGNPRILQRVAELKALMRIIGKGDELLIANLEGFLAGIKRHFGRVARDSEN